MHVISTLLLQLSALLHTSGYFLLVHAITSGGLPAYGDERDSFLPHHPGPERSPTHDAFPENQQHLLKAVTSDSSPVPQSGAENNSNSFAVLRVEDVTSKSIKVRLETRAGASPIVPQKMFFKNVQRNSDWKHFVVDEKRHRDENGSFILTNLLCGNKYQIYGASIDREGLTAASEVLLTKTAGREPLAPPVTATPFPLFTSSSLFPFPTDQRLIISLFLLTTQFPSGVCFPDASQPDFLSLEPERMEQRRMSHSGSHSRVQEHSSEALDDAARPLPARPRPPH